MSDYIPCQCGTYPTGICPHPDRCGLTQRYSTPNRNLSEDMTERRFAAILAAYGVKYLPQEGRLTTDPKAEPWAKKILEGMRGLENRHRSDPLEDE